MGQTHTCAFIISLELYWFYFIVWTVLGWWWLFAVSDTVQVSCYGLFGTIDLQTYCSLLYIDWLILMD